MDSNIEKYYKIVVSNINKSVKSNFEKGKSLPVGTVRNWKGKLYKKDNTNNWNFIGYANENKKEEEKELEGYDGRPEKLKEIENNIKNKKFEEFYGLTEYGTKVYEAKGNKDSVKIDVEEGVLRDTIITHNHPGMLNNPNKINDTVSLSGQDVLLACKHNVREVRAVGKDGYIYSLKPGNYEDWGTKAGAEKIKNMHKSAKELVKSRFQKKIYEAVGHYGEDSKEADEAVVDAQTNDPHESIKIVASELNLEYNVYKND